VGRRAPPLSAGETRHSRKAAAERPGRSQGQALHIKEMEMKAAENEANRMPGPAFESVAAAMGCWKAQLAHSPSLIAQRAAPCLPL